MSNRKEWQQLLETKAFAHELEAMVEDLKEQAVEPVVHTLEQIAIRNVEITSEIRAYKAIIEKLKEE